MPALLDLVPLAALVLAVGLTLLCIALVKGLFSPLASLPVVGGAIGRLRDTIVHALMSAIGAAISGTERLVGASFHQLARTLDWAWREFRSHANLIAAIATPVGLLIQAYHALKALVRHSTHIAQSVPHLLKAVTREINHLAHRVKTLEHDLSKGIGEDVLPRIKSLDRELHRLTHKVIPSLRAAEAEAAGEIDNLYEWAKGKASLLGVGTFAFAVSSVLAAIGLDWLSCRNGAERVGRSNCNLWDDLGDVFGLLAAAVLVVDFEQFVHDAQNATDATVTAVKDISGLG